MGLVFDNAIEYSMTVLEFLLDFNTEPTITSTDKKRNLWKGEEEESVE